MMGGLADDVACTEGSTPPFAGKLHSEAAAVSGAVEALIPAHQRSVQHSQRYFYDYTGVQPMAGLFSQHLHGTCRWSLQPYPCLQLYVRLHVVRPKASPQLCLLPDAWLTKLSSARLATQPCSGAQAQAKCCPHAGHSILDTTRNITWHMGNDLVFTIAPSSAADVDRTRLPHPSHALLADPISECEQQGAHCMRWRHVQHDEPCLRSRISY